MSNTSFVMNAIVKKVRELRREKPSGYFDVYVAIELEGFHEGKAISAEKEFNLCTRKGGEALNKQIQNVGVGRLTQERFLKQLLQAEGKRVRVRFYPQQNDSEPYGFHIIEPVRDEDKATRNSEHDRLDLEEPPEEALDECFGAADNNDEEEDLFRDAETNLFDSEHDWPDFEEPPEDALVECVGASDEPDEEEFWDIL